MKTSQKYVCLAPFSSILNFGMVLQQLEKVDKKLEDTCTILMKICEEISYASNFSSLSQKTTVHKNCANIIEVVD